MADIDKLRKCLEELILAIKRNESSMPRQMRTELLRAPLASIVQTLKPSLGAMPADLREKLLPALLESEGVLKENFFG